MRIRFDIIYFGGGENGVGQKIKDIAKAEGLSLKEVARRAGIPYTTLYSLVKRDSDNPSMETLMKIAEALCVRLYDLYSFESGSKERLAIDNFEFGYYLGSDATRKFDLQMFAAEPDQVTTSEEAEAEIRFSLSKLNVMGKRVAVERVQELTEIPKYQKEKEDEPDND